ncbi:MAG: SEC-C domain-containing protein [Ignavibacteriae bacterium]|nr:SEC-C domain-containing protein [Ignavibacteriota bacterium]
MNNKIGFHAFTIKANGLLREIVTDIGVSVPFLEKEVSPSDNRIFRTKALWDTGATNCAVTEETARILNLHPISVARISHANGISNNVNVYLVNVYLPNNLIIPGVRVSECKETAGKFGIIIGMDIISHGDFAITNVNNLTTVSFRIPSVQTIDYVAESTIMNNNFARSLNIGRNKTCYCGSGKKYKHCHGKNT